MRCAGAELTSPGELYNGCASLFVCQIPDQPVLDLPSLAAGRGDNVVAVGVSSLLLIICYIVATAWYRSTDMFSILLD